MMHWGTGGSEPIRTDGGSESGPGRVDANRRAATAHQLEPWEAFSLLANETRVDILQTLWDHDEAVVSFSELHAAIGIDRGNFNYHLSELEDHFVRSTDDGYELREAGKQVIRSVMAGTITSDPRVEPTDLGFPCPLCGGSLEFQYADEWITVRCTSCQGVLGGEVPPGTFMHHPFPPAGLEGRADIEVLEAARVRYETELVTMMQGVCPECGGRVDDELHVCADYDTDSDGLCVECGSVPDIWIEHACENCSFDRWCTLWLPMLFHPAVISFVHQRQSFDTFLELRRLFWMNPEYLSGIEQCVVSEDPLRIQVTVPFGDDEISITVDENLNTRDLS